MAGRNAANRPWGARTVAVVEEMIRIDVEGRLARLRDVGEAGADRESERRQGRAEGCCQGSEGACRFVGILGDSFGGVVDYAA